MDRASAVRKVLRCLRLAASSNPNEAAAALRQAKALMDEHGLTELDAMASEVTCKGAATRCRGADPTMSLSMLVNTVAEQFRCRPLIHHTYVPPSMRTLVNFYGRGADPEVAAYAFAVLRRQLEADKARHTSRIRKRGNREARGEEFAIGWVLAVRRNMPPSALTHEQEATIDAAIQALHGELQKSKARDLTQKGQTNPHDRWSGYRAGLQARVNPGVGEEQRRLTGGGE